MLIKIENFGPIEKCEIETKPLTVFVGPNGTGKTWTATLIACLFTPQMWEHYYTAYSREKLSERYEVIEDAIESLLVNGTAKIDTKNFIEEFGGEYISNVARLLPKYMPRLLGSQTISFENLVMAVELNNEKYAPSQNIPSLRRKVSENEDGVALLELYIQKEDPNIYIFTRSNKEIQELPRYITKEIIASFVFMRIHQAYYKGTYFFPAERTGIIQFLPAIRGRTGKETIPTEIASNKNENELIMSMPVADLIRTILTACDFKNQSRRQQLAEKDPKIRRYIELSEILENDILYGGIETIEKPDNAIEILFKLKDDATVFDIPPVSSGIKDLIPLVLYLRYVAEERDLVIIDEPEMNLHPEAQIEIMEFLAMMANSGLNVITTTHSPYLVDHISNLTKAYELKKSGKEKLEAKFKLKNDSCFIDSDNVAAYLFDGNTVKDIFEEDDLIDWDTFGNVSDYVSNLYFDL
ncbi:MAG: hypothetical protein EF813_07050 [Methanosarcinales archaeon]|nr:MAG: hypothetical protein EF813_07050 [Methanosarcinales archaeon]